MRLTVLFMLILCLSACGDNNAVTSTTDSVVEVTNEQSDEISDAVSPPETAEEESDESVEADESIEADKSINADDETVDEDNEISEQNEVESTDETILEEPVTETAATNANESVLDDANANESVFTNINTTESVLTDTNTTESTPAVTTSQIIGETKTFSNGVTFENYGLTPKGLKMWRLDYDTGEFPEFLVAAYDATGITNDMSDYDKAIAINNYICKVVEYGYGQVDDRALTAECLDYGFAICVGYANAFNALCTIAGVGCDTVNGICQGGAHCWNYVLIGDTKYWVDVTANDTTNNAFLMSTTLWADHITGANY